MQTPIRELSPRKKDYSLGVHGLAWDAHIPSVYHKQLEKGLTIIKEIISKQFFIPLHALSILEVMELQFPNSYLHLLMLQIKPSATSFISQQ